MERGAEPEVVRAIRSALERCSSVTSVTLGGSRERGRATELSDWELDVFPKGARRRIQPPWVLSAETLPEIDGHFWDWSLWLGGKRLRGEHELVASELGKMHDFLLRPIGVADAATSLDEAVAGYVRARASAIHDLGVDVDPELGRQVSRALERHGVLARPG